jgi:hypothetical protein
LDPVNVVTSKTHPHQIHPHQDKIFNVRKDTYIVSDVDAGFSERGGWGHSYRLFFGIKISTFDTHPVQVQQKKSSSMTNTAEKK